MQELLILTTRAVIVYMLLFVTMNHDFNCFTVIRIGRFESSFGVVEAEVVGDEFLNV